MRTVATSSLAVIALYYILIILALFGASGLPVSSASDVREILGQAWLSLVMATLATIISLVVGIPASYALSRFRFPGAFLIDTLMDIPILLSPVVTGLALLLIFGSPLLSFLEAAGLRVAMAKPGILVAQTTVISALVVRLMKTTFDGIDVRCEQIARSLGATRWRVFFGIVLPMARHGIIAAGLMAWARAMGEYGATLTLAGMSEETKTLPVGIAMNLSQGNVKGAVGLAASLLIITLVALLMLRTITSRSRVDQY